MRRLLPRDGFTPRNKRKLFLNSRAFMSFYYVFYYSSLLLQRDVEKHRLEVGDVLDRRLGIVGSRRQGCDTCGGY